MLHPGTTGHYRVLIAFSLGGEAVNQLLQQAFRFVQRAAQLQDQPAVDGILAGRPPVNVACRTGILRLHPRGELLHQRNRQVARAGGSQPQGRKIDGRMLAGADDGGDSILRHGAAGCLCADQRRFKIQHPLHPLRIAKPGGQRTAAQHGGQQTHVGSLNTFNNQRNTLTDTNTHGTQRIAPTGTT